MVAALRVGRDAGATRGRALDAADGGEVDAGVRHDPQRQRCEAILADRPDHVHEGPGPAGGDGLVGALAAGLHGEAAGQPGLAGPGERIHGEDEVQVDGPEDDDLSRHQ